MSHDSWQTHELAAGDDPLALLTREWLLTNGTGGYAMGTALGAPTRRYHGLLIASRQPPVARCVMLNQMWERLEIRDQGAEGSRGQGEERLAAKRSGAREGGDKETRRQGEGEGEEGQSSKFKVHSSKQSPDRQIAKSPNSQDSGLETQDFSTLLFRDERGQQVFAPRGHECLERFERSGTFVRWVYQWGDIRFERELMLHWREQAITLRYRVGRGRGAKGSRGRGGERLAAKRSGAREGEDKETRRQGVQRSKFKVQRAEQSPNRQIAKSPNPQDLILRLSPMVTMRDFHGLLDPTPRTGWAFEGDGSGTLRVTHGDLRMTLHCEGAAFEANEQWWHDVHYPCETERGQGDVEDYFVPGALVVPLAAQAAGEAPTTHEVTLTAALGETPAKPCPLPHPRAGHLERLAAKRSGAREGDVQSSDISHQPSAISHSLTIAADDFVVQRRFGDRTFSTIIAGYPWFADWGRDTFIALPGLLLTTGRHDEARTVLQLFAQNLRNGLVPNRFDDYQPTAAHYNTVDGSLWFIHAALRYLKASGDRDSWRTWLGAACVEIVEAYQRGTDYGIHMDGDGLIAAGSPMTQLTWMDAAVGAEGDPNRIVFTPRPGKAVEINALWYAALMGLAEKLEGEQAKHAEGYRALAEKVRQSFGRVFWRDKVGYLLDYLYVDDAKRVHADAKLRPNQIFALSLEHSPISEARQKKVLRAVREALLTPMGLRTLAADDPDYQGRYTGDQFHRDAAYHQGTVWPWLIGPYAEAVLRVGGFSDKARQEARDALAPLVGQLTSGGTDKRVRELDSVPATTGERTDKLARSSLRLSVAPSLPGSIGQLHEIYEGDEPHRAVGCIAQAWSVAEVLRVNELLVASC